MKLVFDWLESIKGLWSINQIKIIMSYCFRYWAKREIPQETRFNNTFTKTKGKKCFRKVEKMERS